MTIYAQDSFNRPDDPLQLGTADLGGIWQQNPGSFGILANRAYPATNVSTDIATLDPGVTDIKETLTIVTGVTGYIGLIARCTDVNNHYLGIVSTTDPAVRMQIYKRVGGAFTLLATSAHLVADGDKFSFSTVGNDLKLYHNGALVASATDGSHPAATKVGLYQGSYLGSVIWNADNFIVTDPSFGDESGLRRYRF